MVEMTNSIIASSAIFVGMTYVTKETNTTLVGYDLCGFINGKHIVIYDDHNDWNECLSCRSI